MTLTELEKYLKQDSNLAPHTDWILSLAKPCVDIKITDSSPLAHNSRFGGKPFVPDDFIYPQHDLGQYEFLGQINFSEIESTPNSILPKDGLLSLFYAFDQEGEVFWRDDDYIIAYYWQSFDNFSVIVPPLSPLTCSAKRITFSHGVDIPRDQYMRENWPFDTDFLIDFIEKLELSEDYLLGYPSHYSLGYNPTPAIDWTSLITITSYDAFNWCWHDADKLMVFIQQDKLTKQDFSKLQADAG